MSDVAEVAASQLKTGSPDSGSTQGIPTETPAAMRIAWF